MSDRPVALRSLVLFSLCSAKATSFESLSSYEIWYRIEYAAINKA